ncbi:MAG: hypothetical protein QNJ34_26825 [Xenococcaceae cyanobacterium MO_188.B29]|nr:hypothetical protein [Xenococcaceae cyanobacterium MO_188.B29]
MSKQQGLLHQETYKTIKKCLEVVNQEGRDNFTNALRSKQGVIAKIKSFLFLNPNKVFILGLTFFGLMSTVSALIIRNNINNILIRLALFLLLSLFYLLITIVIEKMIPRYSMENVLYQIEIEDM